VRRAPKLLYELVTQAVVKHPQYLPAALMGGFGKPGAGKHSRRYAKVCMRRRMDPETTRIVRADKIGIQGGLYDIEDPTSELPADFAEQLWRSQARAWTSATSAERSICWQGQLLRNRSRT
jgi:hypothetical protein